MERIEKFLTQNGICSRQDAKRLIRQKKVSVNGELVQKAGFKIDPRTAKVVVNGMEVAPSEQNCFLILNKPKGYITSREDPSGLPTVYELLPLGVPQNIHAVGRLDVESTGLLLFVSSGELTHRLTHPKHHIEKEYEVVISGRLADTTKARLENGVPLEGVLTKPCRIAIKAYSAQAEQTLLNITLTEGKHRQIRRMFGNLDLPVLALKRIRLGQISLEDLTEGHTRMLTDPEKDFLTGIQ